MVNVSVRTSRRAGVTFAHVLVENRSGERQRVRLALACDEAVWPPRRRGVPEAGWDADGVTVTVAAGGVRGVGFATPATAVDVDHVATTTRGGGRERDRRTGSGPEGDSAEHTAVDESARLDETAAVDESARVDGVVRALGSFAPPLAATPREDREPAESAGSDAVGGRDA